MTDEYADLLEAAHDAREWAYAPHSGHAVGAALLTTRPTLLYTGSNVEVSGRSTSVHAEMMAAFGAVTDGKFTWSALACTERPCAMCAHTLSEWADDDLTVVLPEGTYRLGDFLGESYRPGDHDE